MGERVRVYLNEDPTNEQTKSIKTSSNKRFFNQDTVSSFPNKDTHSLPEWLGLRRSCLHFADATKLRRRQQGIRYLDLTLSPISSSSPLPIWVGITFFFFLLLLSFFLSPPPPLFLYLQLQFREED